MKYSVLAWLVVVCLLRASTPACAFTITDLGTLGGPDSSAIAVGNGWVAGNSDTSLIDAFGNRVPHAFAWSQATGMIDLATQDGDWSFAYGMSNGQVVGEVWPVSLGYTYPFSWTQAGGMKNLGTLGGHRSWAKAVDNGQVVGFSDKTDFCGHAFSWTFPGPMQDLGALGGCKSEALAVSNGQVVGWAETATGAVHAFSWTAPGPMQDLGAMGGVESIASDVSNGQVVVTVDTGVKIDPSDPASDTTARHAFSWTQAGGMVDLGTLPGAISIFGDWVSNGQVVGTVEFSADETHAFSWTQAGKMVDLGTLGGTYSEPYAVSNGQVLGGADTAAAGVGHAFSWTAPGPMQDLGTLPGGTRSGAAAVSNGEVVGGSNTSSGYFHAVLWSLCDNVTCTALGQCYLVGTCNPQTGVCSNPPKADGAGCDDGDACTHFDHCDGSGTCTFTSSVTCTAPDQCHDKGSCDPTSGLCVNQVALTGIRCNFDNNGCTNDDICVSGTCTPGSFPCDDGLFCTTDSCQPTGANTHTCVHTPIIAGTCAIGGACYNDGYVNPANPCQQCDSALSQTAFSNKSNGSACDDSNKCTVGDQCLNGTCTGAVRSCLDGNSCTKDSCDPVTGDPLTGCQHTDLGPTCQSGQSGEVLVGGGQHDCGAQRCIGGQNMGLACTGNGDCPGSKCPYDPATDSCTVSTPSADINIPVGALPSPTYININETPPSPTGPCGFALQNSSSLVTTCLQLEPSGTQFSHQTPVTATFHWTPNTTGTNAGCLVQATAPNGTIKTIKEGTLAVYTPGTCSGGVCALTPPCGEGQGSSTYPAGCPVCPLPPASLGAGCTNNANNTASTLDYSCKSFASSPCLASATTPACDPGDATTDPKANTWTVQLSHFSQYALGSVPPLPDPVQCYRTALISTDGVNTPVTLVDHFSTVATSVLRPSNLCTPTNVNGQTPDAPSHPNYLQGYPLKYKRQQFTAHVPRQRQQVVDQFGTHTLDLTWPDRLLVPTAEDISTPPSPLESTLVDHFTCYGAKPSRGSGRFTPIVTTVEDPFATSARSLTLVRPSRLCVPTDKNGEAIGAENNPWQLMCYRARARRAFQPIGGVRTANEFGNSVVYPWGPEELCVPALRP